jgi:hypothetical protein
MKLVLSVELTAVHNGDSVHWKITSASLALLSLSANVETRNDTTENSVLIIEPRSLLIGDKELGAISVGSRVGH